ncbi:hypothetical protein ACS0TY_002000 [Phlomoides rotata]
MFANGLQLAACSLQLAVAVVLMFDILYRLHGQVIIGMMILQEFIETCTSDQFPAILKTPKLELGDDLLTVQLLDQGSYLEYITLWNDAAAFVGNEEIKITSLQAHPPKIKTSEELEKVELENIPQFKARPLNEKRRLAEELLQKQVEEERVRMLGASVWLDLLKIAVLQCTLDLHLGGDSFYRGLTPEESKLVHEYNFDHLDAFDTEQLLECVEILKSLSVHVPIYDFKTHQRFSDSFRQVNASDVIILEGILVFHDQRVRNLMNMKIFDDTGADVRLARRIRRDTFERGSDINSVLEQYAKFVKPAFDYFVLPSKKYADVIIPRGDADTAALQVNASNVIILEGILIFHDQRVRNLMNMKIFVDTDKRYAYPDSGQRHFKA